ncbi:ATP-grasp domain-containing protein [Marinifilum caeruleilacunae]|uniref:ATP-grasp domain-containing protein n=1 Tax=Marinifilum caeruleilacunae TaxID=2499076 RepID=A0ABX1WU44_9BACT|nr:ATP-grasp domain-containing protein [Marinifilum caeruleilacunae]NOU59527.1 ATP-grasp domain-containing protein [Marinifilum caeruleilacunae]
MILLDKPYVSKFLKETIVKYDFPALDTGNITEHGELSLISTEEIIENFKNDSNSRLYTNSENSINWVVKNLGFTKLPEYINVFKNKVEFRKLVQSMYPSFFFREVGLKELDEVKLEELPMPFIIKPAVGFLSLGVHKVLNAKDWAHVKELIKEEFTEAQSLFPIEVVNASSFLIEEIIEGEEFAFDAFFDEDGEATVLGVSKHLFSSDTDVSDRVYFTSKETITNYLEPFTNFVQELGNKAKLKNFPVHVEVRVDKNGIMIPIEVNPMRFGGWCTTADLTYFATGLNPYYCFLKNIKPNWNQVLEEMDDEIYSLIILDNSTGIPSKEISNFDYDALLNKFMQPLELRKVDYKMYSIFGMLYTKTPKEQFAEIEEILVSDLKEFVQ